MLDFNFSLDHLRPKCDSAGQYSYSFFWPWLVKSLLGRKIYIFFVFQRIPRMLSPHFKEHLFKGEYFWPQIPKKEGTAFDSLAVSVFVNIGWVGQILRRLRRPLPRCCRIFWGPQISDWCLKVRVFLLISPPMYVNSLIGAFLRSFVHHRESRKGFSITFPQF